MQKDGQKFLSINTKCVQHGLFVAQNYLHILQFSQTVMQRVQIPAIILSEIEGLHQMPMQRIP